LRLLVKDGEAVVRCHKIIVEREPVVQAAAFRGTYKVSIRMTLIWGCLRVQDYIMFHTSERLAGLAAVNL